MGVSNRKSVPQLKGIFKKFILRDILTFFTVISVSNPGDELLYIEALFSLELHFMQFQDLNTKIEAPLKDSIVAPSLASVYRNTFNLFLNKSALKIANNLCFCSNVLITKDEY